MLEHEPALFCAVSSRAPRRCVIVALWTLDGATRRAVMALRVTGQRRAVAGKRRQLPIEANFKEVAPPLLLLKVPQCSVHSLCACWLNFARDLGGDPHGEHKCKFTRPYSNEAGRPARMRTQ